MRNVKCGCCYYMIDNWCECVLDSPDVDVLRDCQYFRQKTTRDFMHEMEDKELAYLLKRTNFKALDVETIEEWLQAPVNYVGYSMKRIDDADNKM